MYAALKRNSARDACGHRKENRFGQRYGSTHEQWALKHPGRIWIRAGDRKLARSAVMAEKREALISASLFLES